MPFGAQSSYPPFYYAEQFLNVSWNTVVAQGATWNANVGSVTMPWTGDVLLDGSVQMNYTSSILGVEVWPASAIGPGNFWAGKLNECHDNGGSLVCPILARWAGLTSGTFLQVTVQVRVTIANGTATATGFVGSLRAQAA